MKIEKLILRKIFIAAGFAFTVGCDNAQLTDSAQSNSPEKTYINSQKNTKPLPGTNVKNAPDFCVPDSDNLREVRTDPCEVCGRG